VVGAVREELKRGVKAGHSYLERATAAIAEEIEVVDPAEYPPFHRGELDVGERESLAVAIAVEGVLATDDLAAREVARMHGQPTTGSIGLLVLGIERGLIDVETAERWLSTWRTQRGYYSPVEQISDVLDM
jgi:predicted nucleic acid-binding protein